MTNWESQTIPPVQRPAYNRDAMELAQYQLQIFVSLVVILAAAFVALICDFLKGNNEQLRELTVELRVRREEDQRRLQSLTAHRPERLDAPAARSMAAPPAVERKRTASPDALAAMERGARLASPPRVKPEKPVEVTPEVMPQPAAAPKKDWSALLSRKPQSDVPAGFHEGFVLSQLVQNRQPVSGLVVSIGVNASGSMPRQVTGLMQSLIGPDDFACQTDPEEFLLIYPNESGASAQKRLSLIAQQLWDFQLRSLGSFQILFSWGGVEVKSESIEEAVASASERMQETRRGRKLLTMESRQGLKKAV